MENNLIRQMLEQIHQRLKAYKLQEGFKSNNDFDVSKVVSPASISKWSKHDTDKEGQKKIFKAARKGDKSALEYIFWKMKGAIQGAFWKNYLGPNGAMRKYRIQHENAWEQWLGIAWMTLVGGFSTEKSHFKKDKDGNDTDELKIKGAIDTFDVDKIDAGNPMSIFANRYRLMLRNSAGEANHVASNIGMTGTDITMKTGPKTVQYEPTWYEKGDKDGYNPDNDDSGSSSGPSYQDETFDIVNNNEQTANFLNNWKKFAQDPRLKTGTKGTSIANLFFEAISDKDASYADLAAKYHIARNSVATCLQKAVEILSEYGITGQDLMYAIKTLGNDKISSYLGGINAEQKADKPGPKPKAQKTTGSSFNENFQSAMAHEKMWTKGRDGYDAGNMLFWWINDNYPTIEELASEYQIAKGEAKWYLNRAFTILRKFGIDEDAVKAAVKKSGKKAITSLIGDDA